MLMRFSFLVVSLFCAVASMAETPPSAALGWSFDTGRDPAGTAQLLREGFPASQPWHSWLRIRGVGTNSPVDTVRENLQYLRQRGYGIVVLLYDGTESWYGVRSPIRENRLPSDLREAFDRMRAFAATYGDLVDYWEISNEPDISFVQENPETYTAYLKACYMGVQRGNLDRRRAAADRAGSTARPPGPAALSQVLMAPLALPPGPYFEAFVANGGLSCTDGFNYHYYGYAEDFTDTWRQFEEAVRNVSGPGAESALMRPAAPSASVYRTRFFPSADGWRGTVLADFTGTAPEAAIASALSRPRAAEEPAVHRAGRWLVTDGVKVEEVADGTWRFTIDHFPSWPFRAPGAELVLPPNFPARFPPGAMVSLRYRRIPGTSVVPASQQIPIVPSKRPEGDLRSNVDAASQVADSVPAPVVAEQPSRSAAELQVRELPIFLTEYGYATLDKISRHTAAGRERQRLWFADVRQQIRRLGIEGAMAFLLNPYIERNQAEFGLLMEDPKSDSSSATGEGSPATTTDAAAGPASVTKAKSSVAAAFPPKKLGPYVVSPALTEILQTGSEPLTPRRWKVATVPPRPVVIDFIAGRGLGQAKSYGGYFLEGPAGRAWPATGELVIYNFGDARAAGQLRLTGDAWRFSDDGSGADQIRSLELAPGERRTFAVEIAPHVRQFIASEVGADFIPDEARARPPASGSAPAAEERQPSQETRPVAGPRQHVVAPPVKPVPSPNIFECYFRTENGNLYHTWPRLLPTPQWQVYMQRMENFTMGFWGRAHLPWRFSENRPVSLTFFFHPDEFPVVYEVRATGIVQFEAPDTPQPGR
jgi:hypothetical protein